MTQIPVDEMSGEQLAVAIALARGWRRLAYLFTGGWKACELRPDTYKIPASGAKCIRWATDEPMSETHFWDKVPRPDTDDTAFREMLEWMMSRQMSPCFALCGTTYSIAIQHVLGGGVGKYRCIRMAVCRALVTALRQEEEANA